MCELIHIAGYDFLKKQYVQLVERRSFQVIRTYEGTERTITIHKFIWDCLKLVHRQQQKDLDDLVRRMVGDVKKYGLNPGLRHPKAKAKVLHAPPALPSLLPAHPVVPLPPLLPPPAPAPAPKPPSLLVSALAASAAHVPKQKPKPKHAKAVLKVFGKTHKKNGESKG